MDSPEKEVEPLMKLGGKIPEPGRPSHLGGKLSDAGRLPMGPRGGSKELGARPSFVGPGRASDVQAIQKAMELARLSEGPNALLTAKNREMLEMQDELLQLQKRLESAQIANKALLEESSEVDSEVHVQSIRAGKYEERLAALFEADEAESMHGAEAEDARVTLLRSELASRIAQGETINAEAAAERERAARADHELESLQAALRQDDALADELREALRDVPGRFGGTESVAMAAAADAIERRLAALALKTTEHQQAANFARQHLSSLEREHALNSSMHAELEVQAASLASNHLDCTVRLRDLESTLKSRGQSAFSMDAAASAAAAVKREKELRNELDECVSQLSSLQTALARTREDGAKSAARLQAKLDQARVELQNSLREHTAAHEAVVEKLRTEVDNCKREEMEQLSSQRNLSEHIEDLKVRYEAAQARVCAAKVDASTAASRLANVTIELQSAKAAVLAQEGREVRATAQVDGCVEKRRDAERVGKERVAKVRGMIEELWTTLRTEGSKLSAIDASVSTHMGRNRSRSPIAAGPSFGYRPEKR